MKVNTWPLSVLGVVIIAVGCSAGPDSSSGALSLVVEPHREVVPVEGPILARVVLHNETNSPVSFRPILMFGHWLDAEITGPDGTILPRTLELDPPNQGEIELQPGDSLVETVDLRCGAPLLPDEEGCLGPYSMTEPGEYTFRAQFTAPCWFDDCEDTFTVRAPIFRIRVN